ncbi:UbiH/UbiF family hydroxylase [Roseibium limicola]|uniref:UbiH/UbiF family hydroxylase n=1 Tax=Roseibium limicola TaxID=2816037 RepID=A0A939EKV4_9HYPH|nr:UbiH/UbiF family hydroxylase [Roseibium limicola]MBO0344429.1 UbiH/UbiF family hydroxylase [Roseibium limicola]
MTAQISTPVYDIAVVGAGPAGMTAALLLAKTGYRTVLVAPGANLDDGRTTALLQSSAQIYEGIGLWEAISAHTAPLRRMRMIDGTGRLIRAPEVTFDSAELELDAFGYNILNKDLNKVLDEAVSAEPALERIAAFAGSYDFAEDQVTIALEDGQAITAKLCVAADGRRSPAREAAGIDVKSWSYPQTAIVLNLEHDQPHQDTSNEFHTPTGPFTLVPLPGNKSSLVCVVKPDDAEPLLAMAEEALALELERRAHSILGKMKLASKPQSFPLSGLTANALVGPRLALIGEAAHVFPPIGAQGLNLGLRDVASLVGIVGSQVHKKTGFETASAKDPGTAVVLKAYEKDRWQDINSRTAAVDALNRSLLTDFLPVQVVRSAGLYLANRIGPLRRYLMREGIAPQSKRPGLPLPVPGALPKPRLPTLPKLPRLSPRQR